MTPGLQFGDPNRGWWGRLEPPAALPARRARLAAAMAAHLGVNPAEIAVRDVPDPHGITLIGHWDPHAARR